jgi:hypothetical protein
MQWEALEHTYTEKTNDWYAAVIVVGGALAALMFYFENYLSVVLVVIGTFAFVLLGSRRPKMIKVTLNNSGIIAGKTVYPYASMDAFNVVEHPREHKIILESKSMFAPLHIIPIANDVDLEAVRDYLAEFLPEKELYEPLAQQLMEHLGF